MAFDFREEARLARETTCTTESFTLPDGRVIRLGAERFTAPEALMNPRQAGCLRGKLVGRPTASPPATEGKEGEGHIQALAASDASWKGLDRAAGAPQADEWAGPPGGQRGQRSSACCVHGSHQASALADAARKSAPVSLPDGHPLRWFDCFC